MAVGVGDTVVYRSPGEVYVKGGSARQGKLDPGVAVGEAAISHVTGGPFLRDDFGMWQRQLGSKPRGSFPTRHSRLLP